MGLFGIETKRDKEIKALRAELSSQKNFAVSSSSTDLEDLIADLVDAVSTVDLYKIPSVYKSFNYICDQISMVKFNVIDEPTGNVVVESFGQKLRYPSAVFTSGAELIKHLELNYMKYGRVFLWDSPRGLVVLKETDLDITVGVETGAILSVTLRDKRQDIPIDEIIFLNMQNNPDDPVKSFSVLDILRKNLEQMIRADDFVLNFFNGGWMSGYMTNKESTIDITNEKNMNAYQTLVKLLTKNIRDGKLGFIPNNFTLETVAGSNKDAMTLEFLNRVDEVVYSTLNIPNSIANKLTNTGSYALAKQEREMFYYDTLDPMINYLESALNLHIRSQYNQRLMIQRDTTSVWYLQKDRLDMSNKVISLVYADLITQDEAREMLGLEPMTQIDNPQGDTQDDEKSYLEKYKTLVEGMREITANADQQIIDLQNSTIKVVDDEEIKALKERNWKVYLKRMSPLERDFAKEIKNAFINFGEEIEKNAQDVYGEKDLTAVKSISDNLIDDELFLIFQEEIQKVLNKYYKRSTKRGVQAFNDVYDFATSFQIPTDSINAWISNEIVIQGTTISNTAKDIIIEKMDEALSSGSFTMDTLSQSISEATGINVNRSKTIARTESAKAFNHSHQEQALGVNEDTPLEKAWSSSMDSDVRDSHMNADRQGWIAMDGYFDLNGIPATAPHSDDLSGYPGEIINCRCTPVYRAKGEEDTNA